MVEHKSCELSVVIPVYGGELVLQELVKQLDDVFQVAEKIQSNYEVIFVCDQSPDNSWEVISKISKDRPQVSGMLLRVNAGQHNAIMAGLSKARGKIIVTMDDDLQHSPGDIPKLLQAIYSGYDLAFARFKNRNHPLWKRAGSWLNNYVASYLIKKPKDLYLSPFRAFRSEVCSDLLLYRGPYVYIDGLLLGVTSKITSVDVDHHNRYAGYSEYGFVKSLSLWLKMAINFSIAPLRLTSLLGFLFSAIGIFFAILFVIQKLIIDKMPDGWSSIMVALLITGGVQLMALGMIGEYLGRVLLTINSKPQYVVGETVGFR
ncbi:undecaprenyl-phosphate 4-deoxy-4-formamido-L-arabinose transferase [Polynucleobacter meluiroseus]|uniref:Undecaprenyl-phosphate 4-deoxy-4-formamido-L-arabinose transferase n=2 Tax=Polynucleobacter meluiroseus TaxID=1938814 RepID=A0A240E407_9BURK|nr:undecaprenyl-phosphate 4-deoxy-4-formamido-L-arabinose transferase [Polynucleobacter meluiroseus]